MKTQGEAKGRAEAKSLTKWSIDPAHSDIAFKVKHMMISSVTGYFEEFNALVETEGNDFKDAIVNVRIKADSINTRNDDRDKHLQSDDFFNAEEYPYLTFESNSFDGSKMTGELTIRDVTKEVTLDAEYFGTVKDPNGNTKAGFELTGSINRKDYGLKWDAVTEADNVVVSDKVKLIINAQLVKQEN